MHQLQCSGIPLFCASNRENPEAHTTPKQMKPLEFREIRKLEISDEHAPTYSLRGGNIVVTARSENTEYELVFPCGAIRSMFGQAKATKVSTPQLQRRKPLNRQIKPGDRRVGENSHKAKLTEADVREIRAMAVDKGYIASFGSKYAAMLDLSRIYKIHVTQVYKIVNRQSWKTVS